MLSCLPSTSHKAFWSCRADNSTDTGCGWCLKPIVARRNPKDCYDHIKRQEICFTFGSDKSDAPSFSACDVRIYRYRNAQIQSSIDIMSWRSLHHPIVVGSTFRCWLLLSDEICTPLKYLPNFLKGAAPNTCHNRHWDWHQIPTWQCPRSCLHASRLQQIWQPGKCVPNFPLGRQQANWLHSWSWVPDQLIQRHQSCCLEQGLVALALSSTFSGPTESWVVTVSIAKRWNKARSCLLSPLGQHSEFWKWDHGEMRVLVWLISFRSLSLLFLWNPDERTWPPSPKIR